MLIGSQPSAPLIKGKSMDLNHLRRVGVLAALCVCTLAACSRRDASLAAPDSAPAAAAAAPAEAAPAPAPAAASAANGVFPDYAGKVNKAKAVDAATRAGAEENAQRLNNVDNPDAAAAGKAGSAN
jgi:hypothetical protein